ncbi:hypothetical protein Ctha_0792 [Chloroherpeton thalassium ATCC 35110]|uniref:Organic solvent tolerance-like N-terminal domain-containing protein n=1 Tax=Chloroherpeton thalassium (strain ATCC 35110 / GB-78) TaxID=517418 RepID=B3QWE7_CHLT3|nr:OstA-like protein [Chloroherpeton thalassium]ACF13260.1 hypothetical protein Ctha_0792 [Chloroherpeton thalassium ATCC 35110]
MRISKKVPLILFFCLLLFGQFSPVGLLASDKNPASAPKDSSSQKKVYLEYADEVAGGEMIAPVARGEKGFLEPVRSAFGHVKFVETTTTVECDTATEFLTSRKIRLAGHVVIVRDTVIVKGDEGYYYPDERHSELERNVSLYDKKVLLNSRHGEYFSDEQRGIFTEKVSLEDKKSTLFCDSLVYLRRQAHSTAVGNVRLLSHDDNSVITGGYAEHFNQKMFSFIEESPVLTKLDTAKNGQVDTLLILARRMEAYRNPRDSARRINLIDSVRIWRGHLVAKSKRAKYMIDEKKIILTGKPIIWFENTEATGDSIEVKLKKTNAGRVLVEKIFFYTDSFLASKDSLGGALKKFNQLSGINMVMTFDDSLRLTRTDVYQQARSLYYLYDKETPNGANYSSGDEINIFFEQNQVARIKITGGVEGVQYPEQTVITKDLNLPNFKWRASEKPVRPKITAF